MYPFTVQCGKGDGSRGAGNPHMVGSSRPEQALVPVRLAVNQVSRLVPSQKCKKKNLQTNV